MLYVFLIYLCMFLMSQQFFANFLLLVKRNPFSDMTLYDLVHICGDVVLYMWISSNTSVDF